MVRGQRTGPHRAASGEAGFSLVELLVTVIILAEILVGLLIIFDSSSRLARAQTHAAELQQSLRVGQSELTRFARMAGRGGLPITPLNEVGRTYSGTFPQVSPAVSVFNNVEEQTIVQLLDSTAPDGSDDVILPGSDVLVLRGVFDTPMYYIDPPLDISPSSTEFSMANPDTDGNIFTGTITLRSRTRVTGRSYWDYPQDLDELATQLEDARVDNQPLALILRDTLSPNAYVVMAFDPGNTDAADLVPADCLDIVANASLPAEHIPQCISFGVRLEPAEAASTGPGRAYTELSAGTGLTTGGGHRLVVDSSTSPQYTVQLPTNIGSVGLLEEHRLFLRAEWEVPGQFDTRLTPVLSRAEFLPGTNTQIDRIDVADNVLDLQIAIGADADSVLSSEGYGDVRDTNSANDEVLFNSVDDTNPLDGTIVSQAVGTDSTADWSSAALEFHYLRINTLVQARFPDLNHRAPEINVIEDYNRGASFSVEGVTHNFNNDTEYRRRWLQTVIELRNLL